MLMFSPRRSTFANSFTNSERSEASTRSDFLKVPHPALRADLSRRGEALRRRGIFLWPVLLIALAAPRALAAEDYNLSLNAGETYVIKDLDPDVTALVKFFDHAHPFTVQSSAAGRLVVLGVEKGRGIITVARDGEGVRYHIAVNAIFDAKHPLAPGTAPAALTDEDTSKAEQHVSASAATPVSPGDAAQATATESVPITGPVPIVRDTKISAEPGDPALVPGAASTASPSANSAASPAGGDVSVSSYTSPADPGARPVGKPLAHSLPVPLPLCCGRGEVRVTAGEGEGSASLASWRTVTAGVLLGLAILTKGPLAAGLLALAAFIYLLLLRANPLQPLTRAWPWAALALGLAIACCWYVPAFIAGRASNLGGVFFHENLGHLLPASAGGTGEAARPVYYIGLRIIGGSLPLSLLIPALMLSFRGFAAKVRRDLLYQLAMALAVLLLFSLASAKRDDYILPALPPLAILFAALFACVDAAGSTSERIAAMLRDAAVVGSAATMLVATTAIFIFMRSGGGIGMLGGRLASADESYAAIFAYGIARLTWPFMVFIILVIAGAGASWQRANLCRSP